MVRPDAALEGGSGYGQRMSLSVLSGAILLWGEGGGAAAAARGGHAMKGCEIFPYLQ